MTIDYKHMGLTQAIKLALAILLLVCLFDMPYGYYQFVRFLGMIAFIYFGVSNENLVTWRSSWMFTFTERQEIKAYLKQIQQVETTLQKAKTGAPNLPTVKACENEIERIKERLENLKRVIPNLKYFWFGSAVLINPFLKIALGGTLWNIVDVIWAIILIATLSFKKQNS